MDDYRKESVISTLKFALGFFLLACLLYGMCQAVRSGSMVLWLALTLFLIGWAFIYSPTIAQFFAKPVGKLFYSGEEFDRPQPMYSVAEGKRKNGFYEEAFEAFRIIAEKYPQELKPYVGMIDIAVVDMKNREKAERVFMLGVATLEDKAARDTLAEIYKSVGSRLDLKPLSSQHTVEMRKHDLERLPLE